MLYILVLGLCFFATLANCDGTAELAPYITTVNATDLITSSNSSPSASLSPYAIAASTKSVYVPLGSPFDATASSLCGDFIGACIVYETKSDGAAEYVTTIYSGALSSSSNNNNNLGDNENAGVIGSRALQGGDSQGFIAAAPPLSMWTIGPIIGLALVNLGFMLFM